MQKEANVRDKIKEIMKKELNFLLSRISNDFKNNYGKKLSNWTLADFDSTIIAHMVFVSSFESKSGNMFQNIAREIAKIRYGEENVPMVFRGAGISEEEFENFKKDYNLGIQVVLTKINPETCQGFVSNFKEIHRARGKGKKRTKPTLNQEVLKEINEQEFNIGSQIYFKPVDLIIYNSQEDFYYFMEIKAGGGLDSSNAPANVVKMLTEYALAKRENIKSYFATLYNFNGEGKVWNGQIIRYLSDEMLLIGKSFWKVVLPKEISFEELGKIYSEVNKELEVNEKITKLIKEVKD